MTCSRMQWTVPCRRWRSTILRRTSPPTSKRSLTKSTTPHGTALLGGTLAATWRMRRSILSTSTWVKWLFYSLSQAETQHYFSFSSQYFCATPYIRYHLSTDMPTSWLPAFFSPLLFANFTTVAISGRCISQSWTDASSIEKAKMKLLIMTSLGQHLHIW